MIFDFFQNGLINAIFINKPINGLYTAFIVIGFLFVAAVGYLLGSMNFAIIISKNKYHDDIRNYGSGNAGMTNMLRTYGKGAAVLTILGDFLKAVLAIIIGLIILGRGFGGNYIGGLFSIIGHVFPIYFGLKGGKGVVTAATTLLLLNPTAFLIIFAVFLLTVLLTRYISLGSIISACLYPFVIYITTTNEKDRHVAFLFAFLIAVFIIFLHRENIKRLASGKESKLSFKKKKEEPKTYTVKSAEKVKPVNTNKSKK